MDIYVDHAGSDPRSVKAWLAGNDDGRGLLYAVFRTRTLRANPRLTDVEVGALYRRALENGWEEENRAKLAAIGIAIASYAAFAVWLVIFT